MKAKLKYILLPIVIVASLGAAILLFYKPKKVEVCNEKNNTELVVINNTKDSVMACLTLGSIGDTNYVQSTIGIFGITEPGDKNFFWLAPNDTLSYISSKSFNGNLCFGSMPNNCPDTNVFRYGLNLFEFNLNNIDLDGQETIDISAVSGVNSLLNVILDNDSTWNNGVNYVSSFYNDSLYKNTGLNGVYPFGCDICTGISKNTPYCEGHRPYAIPQKNAICNIQRNVQGGKIKVVFNGFIK